MAGRKPVGKKAMTPAQRQQRRRRKLKAERSADTKRIERLRRRDEEARNYKPMPPGITYYRKLTIRAGEDATAFVPITKPLAACERSLEDDEVVTLIRQLHQIARDRGIPIPLDDGVDYGAGAVVAW